MRLRCFRCGKSVSTEVDDETVVRACLVCPECIPTTMKFNRQDRRRFERELANRERKELGSSPR